jgi:phosphatidylglycerophosphate synthase
MDQNKAVPNNANQAHTRVINTFLGGMEKKALIWMAARTPAWVVPDTLTMIGLAAAFIIFAGYALSYINRNFLWLASFGFILHWFGDSMDGTLARYRKIERPRYGFFVDHIVDALSEALIFISLGLSPYVRFDLALLALIGYLMVSVYVYLVTYVEGVFRISYAGLGPTEMRLIAIIANVVVYFAPNPKITIPAFWVIKESIPLTYYDLVAIGIVLLAIYVFTTFTIKTALELSESDREASRQKKQQARLSRRQRIRQVREERALRKDIRNNPPTPNIGVPRSGQED